MLSLSRRIHASTVPSCIGKILFVSFPCTERKFRHSAMCQYPYASQGPTTWCISLSHTQSTACSLTLPYVVPTVLHMLSQQVAAALQSLGPLASWQEALDMHIDTLLHAWLDVIGPNNLHATQLPPVSTTASKTIPATAAEGPGGGAGQRVTPQQQQQHEQHEQTIPGRAPYTPSIDACWYGIKVLLQCMEVMSATLLYMCA